MLPRRGSGRQLLTARELRRIGGRWRMAVMIRVARETTTRKSERGSERGIARRYERGWLRGRGRLPSSK